MRLTLEQARRVIIGAQGLDGRWRLPRGRQGVAQAIERLGYVQIDTISVVERAHHHTLWSRCPEYVPEMLHGLHAEDRRVFEYWSHAASYLPMADYRFFLPRMRTYREAPRIRAFLDGNPKIVTSVLDRIRSEGALGSADFAAPPGHRRGTWWSWKPAKRALEALFTTGELMIAERRGFQRIYDLPERVLPADVDTTEPEGDEVARFFLRQTLRTQGVSTLQQRQVRDADAMATVLAELVDSGEVTPVQVEGVEGRDHYALKAALRQRPGRRPRRKRVHILSPFDGLVIWRDRLRRLFDFDYTLECYTPAAQRQYGYFCLPILWGEGFVGRLDAKAERRRGVLVLKRLMLERGLRDSDELLPDLAAALLAFAAFNRCHGIEVQETQPRKIRGPLRRILAGSSP